MKKKASLNIKKSVVLEARQSSKALLKYTSVFQLRALFASDSDMRPEVKLTKSPAAPHRPGQHLTACGTHAVCTSSSFHSRAPCDAASMMTPDSESSCNHCSAVVRHFDATNVQI